MQRSAICCPNCGAIESINSEKCYRCGAVLTATSSATAEKYGKDVAELFNSDSFLTRTLQVILGIDFLAAVVLTVIWGGTLMAAFFPDESFANTLDYLGALKGNSVLAGGEWYRLFTAIFAHFGLLHLLFNSMALGAVGIEAERNLGKIRFLVIFMVGGVLSNFASLMVHGNELFQVGASGAICALIGSLYMIARIRGGLYGEIVRRVVTRWIVLTLIFGFLVPGIDNAAHIAGMIFGAGLTKMLGIKS